MISVVTSIYITTGALEAIVTLSIALKTFRQRKKIRIVMLFFSLLTLPASIINILVYSNIVSSHWNAFVYLISTFLMLALHFWLNLDIGRHLRIGGINYKSPFVIAGAIALAGSMLCLSAQLIILLVQNNPYSMRPIHIASFILAIICDSVTYIYSFSTLVHFKSQRSHHEGLSKTTAIGVWYLALQMLWYVGYGSLYIWFFSMNSWDYFTTLLMIDYAARYVLCFIHTCSPPKFAIDYMTGHLSSGISHTEDADDSQSISAFTITEAKDSHTRIVQHQNSSHRYTQLDHIDDLDCIREDILYCNSDIAKVPKP